MGLEVVLPQPGYQDVRRWPRYKVDVPVRVIIHQSKNVGIVSGRGRELNGGGMAVFAGTELSLGEHVAVEFTPPYTGQPVRVRCAVRNRKGYTYGLEFITENDADYKNVGYLEFVLKGMASRVE